MRDVHGMPEIFVTGGGQGGPPGPGTELAAGTQPDWQPVAPFPPA